MLISIAIPCYKSAKTLPHVIEDINYVFNNHPEYDYEIVLVNDGSPDNTFEIIHRICAERENVTGLNLSKNFGQRAAKCAAIPYINGDILIYMDDDGQHPASGIIPMIDKIKNGSDIVYARFNKKKHSLFKRLTSKIHHWLLTKSGSKPDRIELSSFVAYSSFSVKALKDSDSPVVATGAYLRKLTNRVDNITLEHQHRKEGKSNYTLSRLFQLWLHSITSFNILSLRLATIAGLVCGACGILGALGILIQRIIYPQMQAGYASTMVVILVLCGMIMFLIGILGEYIGKMYLILCNLPAYKVREELGANLITKDKKHPKNGERREE
jgi:undecaprenyl-phosphate 4-deoxy-4-formamido-L-arabinose transferase